MKNINLVFAQNGYLILIVSLRCFNQVLFSAGLQHFLNMHLQNISIFQNCLISPQTVNKKKIQIKKKILLLCFH